MKKTKRILVFVLAACILLFGTVALAAEGDANAIGAMNNLVDLLYGVTRVIGVVMVLWGIVQLGISLAQHDPSQRITAFMFIVGGILILFAKEIIGLIGGSGSQQ